MLSDFHKAQPIKVRYGERIISEEDQKGQIQMCIGEMYVFAETEKEIIGIRHVKL